MHIGIRNAANLTRKAAIIEKILRIETSHNQLTISVKIHMICPANKSITSYKKGRSVQWLAHDRHKS